MTDKFKLKAVERHGRKLIKTLESEYPDKAQDAIIKIISTVKVNMTNEGNDNPIEFEMRVNSLLQAYLEHMREHHPKGNA